MVKGRLSREGYKRIALDRFKFYFEKAERTAEHNIPESRLYFRMAESCMEAYFLAETAPYGTFRNEKTDKRKRDLPVS